MTHEAILNQLGYTPNEALSLQLSEIEKATEGYDKIIKHILDLHEALKTDESYVALSNNTSYFKIKIDATSKVSLEDALNKIEHFREKYKVKLKKVDGKMTYYILGFSA